MIESIPRYSKFVLSDDNITASLHAQVCAKFVPSRINWPDEPWTPSSPVDKILKALRDKYNGV